MNFSVAGTNTLTYLCLNAMDRLRRPRLTAALATLLAVEAFELTDGFGWMANVWDPIDLLANALGIAVALVADAATTSWLRSRTGRVGPAPS